MAISSEKTEEERWENETNAKTSKNQKSKRERELYESSFACCCCCCCSGCSFFNLMPFPLFFGIAHTHKSTCMKSSVHRLRQQAAHRTPNTHLHNLINDRNEQQQQKQKCAPFLCHFSVPFLCFSFFAFSSSSPSSPSLSPLSSLFSLSFFSAPNLRVFLAIPTFPFSYPFLRSRLQTCSKSSLARSLAVFSVQYFVRW